MNEKSAAIAIVLVVLIAMGAIFFVNQQAQAQLAAQRGGPVKQILGGVGGLIDGAIST